MFFQSLIDCDIRPIVIHDGGATRDKNDQYEKRWLQNAAEIRHISETSIAQNNRRSIPNNKLEPKVFCDIIDELGIIQLHSVYEADAECAKLANDLGCPLLANDSDNYIFVLEYGYIPLTTMHFDPVHGFRLDSRRSIYCKLYEIAPFFNRFGLDTGHGPLMSLLAGNDFSPNQSLMAPQDYVQTYRDRPSAEVIREVLAREDDIFAERYQRTVDFYNFHSIAFRCLINHVRARLGQRGNCTDDHQIITSNGLVVRDEFVIRFIEEVLGKCAL